MTNSSGDKSAAGASGSGPAFGYNLKLNCFIYLIMFMLIYVIGMNTCTCSESLTLVMIYMLKYLFISGIKIYRNNPKYLTIQKPYDIDRMFPVSSFASSIKPHVFDGSNFKRWRQKVSLWLQAMNVMWVASGTPPEGASKEYAESADSFFRGAVISALADSIVDTYLTYNTGKEVWDALEAQYGVSDAGSELYVMEQFLDYKMVEDRPVVEQAHEIQALAKDLTDCSKDTPCKLPDKFVAGAIISKLPLSWRDFATSLKHKRQTFSIADLIGTLDVEEKARAKDTRGKGIVGQSSANFVQRNNSNPNFQKKRKKPSQNQPKTKQPSAPPAKKKKGVCYVCESPDHFAGKCPNRKGNKKSANMVVSEDGTSGYGNLLPTVLSVCFSPEWWIDTGANIHVCADISMFSSYQVGGTGSLLMGNGSHARVLGVGTVNLKLTSGKIVQLKNVQHVPTIKKNLVSGSLLCRDGYKLVFESNKCVLSKFGTFVGKGYDSGGLFRFSLSDDCNKVVNNVINVDESNVWHSRLCHVNFGCMSRLASLSLIPKFTSVKNSKCHVCVESKQTRKPHKAAEARDLAPLELIHSDLSEMNGVLTKGGKRYFMTLIDDSTRFCYIYLLKTKDEALDYFKIYKAEVENQLERKIKRLRSDRGGEYFSNVFDLFCKEHGIIHERTPPYSPQSNGVAERKNRTLTDLVNAMLETAGLSKEWWGEAILTACHVLNRVPLKNKEITPFEEWEKKRLTLSYLRTWGCLAKVSVPITKKRKLGPKTVDCVFLGYAFHSVGYRFLVVKSGVPDLHVGIIMESRDATFFEDIFPMRDETSSSRQETIEKDVSTEPIMHNETPLTNIPEEENNEALRKSKRQRTAKSFGDDFIVYLVDDTPRTIEEAYSSPDADYWKEAVRSEMDSIMTNGTWEVVDRPYGCKPV